MWLMMKFSVVVHWSMETLIQSPMIQSAKPYSVHMLMSVP